MLLNNSKEVTGCCFPHSRLGCLGLGRLKLIPELRRSIGNALLSLGWGPSPADTALNPVCPSLPQGIFVLLQLYLHFFDIITLGLHLIIIGLIILPLLVLGSLNLKH
jgi:hypothetical protein